MQQVSSSKRPHESVGGRVAAGDSLGIIVVVFNVGDRVTRLSDAVGESVFRYVSKVETI